MAGLVKGKPRVKKALKRPHDSFLEGDVRGV